MHQPAFSPKGAEILALRRLYGSRSCSDPGSAEWPRLRPRDCASACEQDPISRGSSAAPATKVAREDTYLPTPLQLFPSPCDLISLPPLLSPRSLPPPLDFPMRSPAASWLLPSASPGCRGPWLLLPCRESAPRVHFIPLLIPNILSIARAAQAHSKAQPALPPPVWGQ